MDRHDVVAPLDGKDMFPSARPTFLRPIYDAFREAVTLGGVLVFSCDGTAHMGLVRVERGIHIVKTVAQSNKSNKKITVDIVFDPLLVAWFYRAEVEPDLDVEELQLLGLVPVPPGGLTADELTALGL